MIHFNPYNNYNDAKFVYFLPFDIMIFYLYGL